MLEAQPSDTSKYHLDQLSLGYLEVFFYVDEAEGHCDEAILQLPLRVPDKSIIGPRN